MGDFGMYAEYDGRNYCEKCGKRKGLKCDGKRTLRGAFMTVCPRFGRAI